MNLRFLGSVSSLKYLALLEEIALPIGQKAKTSSEVFPHYLSKGTIFVNSHLLWDCTTQRCSLWSLPLVMGLRTAGCVHEQVYYDY